MNRFNPFLRAILCLTLPLDALAMTPIESTGPRWLPAPTSSPSSDLIRAPILWESLPEPAISIPEKGVVWQRVQDPSTTDKIPSVVWREVKPEEPEFDPLVPMNPTLTERSFPLPPPPVIQSLNRSIAFKDGGVGPDVAWLIPQGFQWSSNHFLDFSVLGSSRRGDGTTFWNWNNGDAVAQIHSRVIQDDRFSFGVNLSFRSVYQGSEFSGGSTSIGEGFSSGFRLDYSLSDTLGVAIGGEQLFLYDSNTDTGRNIYLVLSKAWWLGTQTGSYPLFTGTVGLGSGSLALNPNLQVGCVDVSGGAAISVNQYYPLCWGPVASAAIVLNPYLSIISEFNSDYIVAGSSVALSSEMLPMRFTFGVLLADQGVNYGYVGNNNLRWFFRASLGF